MSSNAQPPLELVIEVCPFCGRLEPRFWDATLTDCQGGWHKMADGKPTATTAIYSLKPPPAEVAS